MKSARVINGEFSGIWEGVEPDMVQFFPVEQNIPPFDPATQRLEGPSFEVFEDRVSESYLVVDRPAEDQEADQLNALIQKIGQAKILKMVLDLIKGDTAAIEQNKTTVENAETAVGVITK